MGVYAAAAGEVVFAGSEYPGRVVIIAHPDGLYSMYGHLDDALAVEVGQAVARGQVLGTILSRTDGLGLPPLVPHRPADRRRRLGPGRSPSGERHRRRRPAVGGALRSAAGCGRAGVVSGRAPLLSAYYGGDCKCEEESPSCRWRSATTRCNG